MPENVSVLAIIATYNEADIIGQVVGDLIGQGVSVYVIDNHSTDDTVARLHRFEGKGLVGIERYPEDTPSDRFDWTGLLRRKEALAIQLGADWVIHQDADEFRESPWTGVDLRSAIEAVDRVGFNAIDFELLEFQLTGAEPTPADDIRAALPYYARPQPFNKVQIRCWKSTGQRVDLASSGGHEAKFAGRRVFPLRFLLRHYPFRSAAQAARKVHRDRIPRFDPGERAQGWHVHLDQVPTDGASFVRQANGFRRYDSDAAKRELWLRNRLVEDELQAHDSLTALLDLLDRTQQDLARARHALEQSDRALTAAHESLRANADHLDATHRRLVDVESSVSWKLTAPGRRLVGWLRQKR